MYFSSNPYAVFQKQFCRGYLEAHIKVPKIAPQNLFLINALNSLLGRIAF